ncbi:MAG: hypothetical protein ACLU4N_15140 [Butyricimonas faecihominis]
MNGRVFIADNIMDYEFGYLDRFTLERREVGRAGKRLVIAGQIEVEYGPEVEEGRVTVVPKR